MSDYVFENDSQLFMLSSGMYSDFTIHGLWVYDDPIAMMAAYDAWLLAEDEWCYDPEVPRPRIEDYIPSGARRVTWRQIWRGYRNKPLQDLGERKEGTR